MSQLGHALTELTDPPVKALVVYNSNPAAIAPNQNAVLRGLRRDDLFTVVLEQFQTDTADHADLLLPVTTFLENTDLFFAYGHYHIQLARPALDPPGECRSNVAIFRELALRMGFDDPCFRDTEDDMIRTLLDSPHPFLQDITLERLDCEHSVRLNISPEGEPFLPFAQGNFGTEDCKVHLDFDALEYTPPIESRYGDAVLRARFPLELISPKNDDSMNSTFGHRDAVDLDTATLHLSTEDAAARGIRSDDHVRVFNDRGSCTLVASVDGRVREGVVCAPAVRWPKRGTGYRNVNAVTSERLTDYGGGATFYSCLVEVERIGD
jgi:anaerobic selenocysteine-containing dehydrogenase